MMKRFLLRLVLFFGCCFPLLSFAQTNPPLTLRFGMGRFYPPFIYNYSTGFDVALASAICQQLKAHCVFYNMSLVQMLTAMQQGKLDVMMGGLSITPTREKIINFTNPYVISTASFLGQGGRVYPKSLAGLKVGVIEHSTFARFFRETPSLGVKLSTARSYGDLLSQLKNQDIDLILLDTPVGNYWAKQSDGIFQVIGGPFSIPFDQGFAIGVQKADPRLVPLLNAALANLVKNGTYAQLVQLYLSPEGGKVQALPPDWILGKAAS